MTIIQGHAPTTNAEQEEVGEFYGQAQSEIQQNR